MSFLSAIPIVAPAPAQAAPGDASACPTCAATLLGEYCHRCGEHDPGAEDRSLRHFFRQAASEVGDLDSRLMRTYRALLARPGFLTLEFLAGRRKGYLGPLKTFLIVFAAVLFTAILVERYAPAASASEGTAGLLDARLRRVVSAVAAREGVAMEAAERELMGAVQKRLSWFAVLVPLLFGAAAHAAFRKRRRWFTENLVFATHFAAFNYLFGLLLIPVQVALTGLGAGAGGGALVSLSIFVVMTAYLSRAVRRVYPGSRWGGLPGSLALLVAFSLCQLAMSLLAIGSAVLALMYL